MCLFTLSTDLGKTLHTHLCSYASTTSQACISHLCSWRTFLPYIHHLLWLIQSPSPALHPVLFLLSQSYKSLSSLCYQSMPLSCSFPAHDVCISASASETPLCCSLNLWSLKRIISAQCLCSASGEVSQLQTPSVPANSAGLISLAFNSPTVHKGSHLNESQKPCSGSSVSHMLLGLCIFLEVRYSAMRCHFRVTARINNVHRDTFSLLTFDYRMYVTCVYAAIFLMLTEIYAVL